jgi:hypothetical protein
MYSSAKLFRNQHCRQNCVIHWNFRCFPENMLLKRSAQLLYWKWLKSRFADVRTEMNENSLQPLSQIFQISVDFIHIVDNSIFLHCIAFFNPKIWHTSNDMSNYIDKNWFVEFILDKCLNHWISNWYVIK